MTRSGLTRGVGPASEVTAPSATSSPRPRLRHNAGSNGCLPAPPYIAAPVTPTTRRMEKRTAQSKSRSKAARAEEEKEEEEEEEAKADAEAGEAEAEEEEEGEDEGEEAEGDEGEDDAEERKGQAKSNGARTVVRRSRRRSTRPSTPVVDVGHAKSTTKGKKSSSSSSRRRPARKQQKKEEEEEEEEEDEEEEEEEKEEGHDGDEAEQEEVEEEGEDDSSDVAPAPKKKRRTEARADSVEAESRESAEHEDDEEEGEEHKGEEGEKKKRKRAPRKPSTRPKRRGKAHLNTPDAAFIARIDGVLNAYTQLSSTLRTACCSRCSSREVYRAVVTSDLALLKAALDAHDTVSDPFLKWAEQCDDALTLAIKSHQPRCVHLLWQHAQLKLALQGRGGYFADEQKLQHSMISQQRQGEVKEGMEEVPKPRVPLPKSTLASLDTGEANFHQFGHATRKLNASRGGKEGNNAFLHDPTPANTDDELYRTIARYGTPDIFELMGNERSGRDPNYFAVTQPKGQPYVTCRQQLIGWMERMGILHAALAGNIPMVRHLLHAATANGNTTGGFNPLHSLVLDPSAKLPVFRAPSTTKKATENDAITPVHLACLSPNTAHLQRLIEVAGPQVLQVTDRYHRKPIHFAAVSSSPAALQLLLSLGAAISDRDKGMKSPLDYAVEKGVEHNIQLLTPSVVKKQPTVEKKEEKKADEAKEEQKEAKGRKKRGRGRKAKAEADAEGEEEEEQKGDGEEQKAMEQAEAAEEGGDVAANRRVSKKERKALEEEKKLSLLINDPRAFLNAKDKKTGDTLLHNAAREPHAGVLRKLIELGAEAGLADKEKLTPVMLLAQRGALEGVKAVVEAAVQAAEEGVKEALEGKLLLQADRTGKSAITFAVMNGHFDLVRYLLTRGVDPNTADTSSNSLLHYAVAYGHYPIVLLLITAGADTSALSMWRLSPLFIAMLKNHLQSAELILSNSDVDVNQKDSEGRTLLMHAVSSKAASLSLCLKQVDFVLEQKGKADVAAKELKQQRNVLHLLAAQPPADDPSMDVQLAEKLMAGVDDGAKAGLIDAQDSEGWTALTLAVKQCHPLLVDWLVTHGASRTLALTEAAGGKSPLMLAVELRPADLPANMDGWEWRSRFPQNEDREAELQRLIEVRRTSILNRAHILRTLLGLPQPRAAVKEAKPAKGRGKGRKGKGKEKAAQDDEEKDVVMTDASAASPPVPLAFADLAAVDSKGESVFFFIARSVSPFSDARLVLGSPAAEDGGMAALLNLIPTPETGGGTVLAEVLRQRPTLVRVTRPTYQAPRDPEAAKAERLEKEPVHHLLAHLQLVSLLIERGADVNVWWRSRLPKSDDPKAVKAAKAAQESRSMLMLALDAPAPLVLPLFTALMEAKATVRGVAAPSRANLLHSLLARVKMMELQPFVQLLAARAKEDGEVAAALRGQAAEVDRDGLTPMLRLWKTALPLPVSTPGFASTAAVPAPGSALPLCPYGAGCYRKNPAHLATHSHPHLHPAPLQFTAPNFAQLSLTAPQPRVRALLASKPARKEAPAGGFQVIHTFGIPMDTDDEPTDSTEDPASTGPDSSEGAVSKFLFVDDNVDPIDGATAQTALRMAREPFVWGGVAFFRVVAGLMALPLGGHLDDRVMKSDATKVEERKVAKAQARLAAMRSGGAAPASTSPLDALLQRKKEGPTQADLHCTALHLAVRAGDAQAVAWLSANGADVMAFDWFQRIPLHLAVSHAGDVAIPTLLLASRSEEQLKCGDALGVSALAMAIGYSAKHSSEGTQGFVEAFAVEGLILSHRGLVDVNAKDRLGRTPLHYIFCPPYEKHTSGSRADPIELLSDFVAATSISSTASSSSSSSSSSSLLLLDESDEYGRTPLLYCSEVGGQICLKYLKARGCRCTTVDVDGNGAFQHALLNRHLGYCVDLVDSGVDLVRPIADYWKLTDGRPRSLSTFEFVLTQNWSGLAYLMMDAGIPLTMAVRDALATDRFPLVATLLKKASVDQLQQVDADTGMNVLHALAGYEGGDEGGAGKAFEEVWCSKLVELLVSRGLDASRFAAAVTVHGQLPLHLAAKRGHCRLIDFLLTAHPGRGQGEVVNALDGYSHAPLHYAVEAKRVRAINLLCQRGATLDWTFLDFPALFAAYNRYRSTASPPIKPKHLEPLPSHLTRHPPLLRAALDTHYDIVELLLRYGANPNQRGDKGVTGLMVAVKANDRRLALLFMHGNASTQYPRGAQPPLAVQLCPTPRYTPADLNVQDEESGRTALHHLVIPAGQHEPSYENAGLLKELVKLSTEGLVDRKRNVPVVWSTADKAGCTAVYYAAQQASGRLMKAIEELKVKVNRAEVERAKADIQRHLSGLQLSRGPTLHYDAHPNIDVDQDSAALRQWLAAQQALSTSADAGAEEPEVEVDEPKLANTYRVYVDRSDAAHPVPYDILLTFTDTSGRHNRFGTHSFYKMQLLYNQPQDLYLLWNRWGRIGTRGEYQQTPQRALEDGLKDFRSIFKSKTGNAWEARGVDQFEVKPGKYTINRAKQGKGKEGEDKKEDALVIPLHQLMDQFHSVVPASALPPPLQTLVAVICDVSSLQAMARKLGVQTTTLAPLGELTDEQVKDAKAVLAEVAAKLEVYTEVKGDLGQVQMKLNQLTQAAFGAGAMHFGGFNPSLGAPAAAGAEAKEKTAEERKVDEEKAALEAERDRLQGRVTEVDGELVTLSNRYFTLVPTSEFAHSAIPAFRDVALLRKQQLHLSQLTDLQIATKILMGARACIIRLRATKEDDSLQLSAINRALSQMSSLPRLNPLDYCYFALRVDMRLLHRTDSEWQLIHRYLHASHPEGSEQQWEVYDAFRVERKGEVERYERVASKLGNRKLLWHGSGVGNFAGLLSQGLRIAPPEADVRGHMFGKGIYAADQFAKSIAYCSPGMQPQFNMRGAGRGHQQQQQQQRQSARTVCLILAEMALGVEYRPTESVYLEKPKPGTDSTLGMGRRMPDPEQSLHSVDGLEVPCGPIVDRPEPEAADRDGRGFMLDMDEFIVYDEAQVRMRYIVRVGPVRKGKSEEEKDREAKEVQWGEAEDDNDDGKEEEEEEGEESEGEEDGDGAGGEAQEEESGSEEEREEEGQEDDDEEMGHEEEEAEED